MKNVVLIGFMGTGKSRVGHMVARRLGFQFTDTDDLIVRQLGMPIAEVFTSMGEAYFREVEHRVITDVSDSGSQVIATGGGVPLREDNMAALRRTGIIFCLRAEPEVIARRTARDSARPLLNTEDRQTQIRQLLSDREPFYDAADYHLDTSARTATSVAHAVIELYQSDVSS